MLSRRRFVGSGFAALAAGWASTMEAAGGWRLMRVQPGGGPHPAGAADPFLRLPGALPASEMINGVPFAPGWTGDAFPDGRIPFHSPEGDFPSGLPPAPTESVDIAIVGGGLSGMTSAHLLRRHNPVLFELHDRFGGTAQGEMWRNLHFSLGSAYFIAPDEGSFLDRLYAEIGADRQHRVSPVTDDLVELAGQIEHGFWDGEHLPPHEREAFSQYRSLVQRYVDQYPEIPLIEGGDNQWILELDAVSLKQHIESELTVPVPVTLASAIQAYCRSSFNAGWNEVSAAAGWNFLAAEEFGRWVLPGGNAGLAHLLWQAIRRPRPGRHGRVDLRPGCRVVDIRVLGADRVQMTYRSEDGSLRSLVAKRAVVCCPKHVANQMFPRFYELDPEKSVAFSNVSTHGYVVANVLLDRRVHLHWYDLFYLRDGDLPMDEAASEGFIRPMDAVNGRFADPPAANAHVLTLYMPLPHARSRYQLIDEQSHAYFAGKLAEDLDTVLAPLGVTRADIRQVRLTRWGHAMPIARPGFIASGLAATVRRPFMDHVFFVNQDNWALPAVETCLLEAEAMRPLIEAGL